jgi:pimeloyl-ACP methyl ester carboxylesterase
MSKTIVLIHGAWLSPTAWDHFAARYEAKGYRVLQPAWPYEEVTKGKASIKPGFEHNTISGIVAKHAEMIRQLPEPPILIGHSFGGLFVQMLLDQGLGAAGVAIDPAPPRGVPPSLSALIGALPVFLAWRGWARALSMTQGQFAKAFMHTASESQQQQAYERYVVRAPGRLYYQSALGQDGKVDFANADRAPLLLIAGALDRTAARVTVEATYHRYGKSKAVTGFRCFANRTHLLIAMPGWEEIADYALDWAEQNIQTSHQA